MPSVVQQIDELGERLGLDRTAERPATVGTQPYRPSKKIVWPADVWAEMQAIWRGERDGEQP